MLQSCFVIYFRAKETGKQQFGKTKSINKKINPNCERAGNYIPCISSKWIDI
jgi:hypothetical protein